MRLESPPPPEPPEPPELFMYNLSAVSAACCIADSLLAPDDTLPWDACWSNNLLAWPIAMPMKAFWLLPPWEFPLWPPVNIFSACKAAAEPMAPEVAG